MVFGDILAKSGDIDQAAVMYETARDLPDSTTWPYLALAEQRLGELEDLPTYFATPPEQGAQADASRATIFEGPYSCVLCHQSSE